MRLEEIAEILRFQDKREPANEGEEGDRNGLVYGEAKPEDFDPVTGFLIPDGMGKVGLFKQPKKYALRKNDILMFYSGSAARIGLAGLVIDDVLAVPARVLVIVRPYAVSPQGLFMFLRSPAIREDIVRMACPTGSETKGFVGLEDLREYEIDNIFINAMNEAEGGMRELIKHYRERRKAEEEMIYEIQKKLLNAWPEE